MLTRDAIGSGQRTKTAEGYLRVPAVFARTGIHDYFAFQLGLTDRPAKEIVQVYRSPEEVFSDEAMASFGLKPVTDDHPPGLIDAATAGQFQVGMSLEDVRRDGDLLCGTLVITDGKAVSAIEAGKRQLSGGYEAEYVVEDGITPEGAAYQAIQKNIRGNHIALVDKGRCGPVCAVADSACGDCDNCPHAGKEGTTVKVKIKDVEHEMSETAGQAVAVLVADNADLERRIVSLDHDMSKMKKKTDELEEEKAKAEGEKDAALVLVADTAALDARAEERASLLVDARRLHPKVITDAQTNDQIRRSVVSELTSITDEDLKSKPEAYVQARFDALAEGGGESARFAQRNLKVVKDGKDPSQDTAIVARDKAIEDTENAWKTEPAKAAS